VVLPNRPDPGKQSHISSDSEGTKRLIRLVANFCIARVGLYEEMECSAKRGQVNLNARGVGDGEWGHLSHHVTLPNSGKFGESRVKFWHFVVFFWWQISGKIH